MAQHGTNSWELDALDPKVLAGLVIDKVKSLIDFDLWNERQELKVVYRRHLRNLSENWSE